MLVKLVLFSTLCSVVPTSADLAGFVYEKMQDFRGYIYQNQLEPTKPDMRNQSFSDSNLIVDLETELGKLVLLHYSVGTHARYIYGDIVDGSFALELASDFGFTALGTHVTNWTVVGTPIRSEGGWNAELPYLALSGCGIRFSVLPSGYLNVTQVITCNSYWNIQRVVFQDITDNDAATGYQDIVEPLLRSAVLRYMDRGAETISDIFGQFWKEVLSNTTLEELIGHTGTYDPTSTTQYSSSSTGGSTGYWTSTPDSTDPTEPTTPYWTPNPTGSTSGPCTVNDNILEEKVLKTRISAEANGELVRLSVVIRKEKLSEKEQMNV